MSATGGVRPPAGWYSDPDGSGMRYWDGDNWTDHRKAPDPAAGPAVRGNPIPAPSTTLRPGEGYAEDEAIRPRALLSVGLAGGLLAASVAFAIFLIAAVPAVIAAWHAIRAGQAINRGESEAARRHDRIARRIRKWVYISLPILGFVALILFLLMVGLALGLA